MGGMSTTNWSESFTSKVYFLKEAYHRVLVHINLAEPCHHEEIVRTLFQAERDNYFLHFCFSWDIKFPLSLPLLESRLQEWKNSLFAAIQSHEPSISLCIPLSYAKEVSTSQLLSSNSFIQLVLLDTEQKMNTSEIRTLTQQSFGNSSLALGLINFCDSDDILDAFLEREAGQIATLSICGVACTNCDNIRVRAIELIHSFGYNSLISFHANSSMTFINPQSAFSQRIMEIYSTLSEKYQASPLCCFGKMYLQLGALLLTPPISSGRDLHVLVEHWSRIVHPFVHRKLFVSEFRVISLYIDDEDIDRICSQSERIECEADDLRTQQYATVAPIVPVFRFGVS